MLADTHFPENKHCKDTNRLKLAAVSVHIFKMMSPQVSEEEEEMTERILES